MEQAFKTIKSYANDSISYGKKSGNAKALIRGNDVLFAILKIEAEFDKIGDLHKLLLTNKQALLYVEEDFAKRIDPGNYNTLEEWKGACTILRNEINA